MAARVADSALEDRKLIGPARLHVARTGEQYGDVETIRKTLRGLDRNFVAAIDHRDAAALQRHQRDWRHVFLGCRNECRSLRPGRGSGVRPTTGFANVDEGELGLRDILGDFPEQRFLLCTGNRDGHAVGKGFLEPIELKATELVCLRDPACAAATDRLRVERHGFLATADQEMRGRRTHVNRPEPRAGRAVAWFYGSAVPAKQGIRKVQTRSRQLFDRDSIHRRMAKQG